VSYALICEHVADFPIQVLCEVLDVSRSGYYAWAIRLESARVVEDRAVAAEIRAAHTASRGRFGSPRMHDALGAWPAGRPQAGRARDARQWPVGQAQAAVPPHDRQRAQPGLAGRPDLPLDRRGLAVPRLPNARRSQG
jgi:hypothetical protein